jgi:hypothetical protein
VHVCKIWGSGAGEMKRPNPEQGLASLNILVNEHHSPPDAASLRTAADYAALDVCGYDHTYIAKPYRWAGKRWLCYCHSGNYTTSSAGALSSSSAESSSTSSAGAGSHGQRQQAQAQSQCLAPNGYARHGGSTIDLRGPVPHTGFVGPLRGWSWCLSEYQQSVASGSAVSILDRETAYLQIHLGHACGNCARTVYGVVTQPRGQTSGALGAHAGWRQHVGRFKVAVTADVQVSGTAEGVEAGRAAWAPEARLEKAGRAQGWTTVGYFNANPSMTQYPGGADAGYPKAADYACAGEAGCTDGGSGT